MPPDRRQEWGDFVTDMRSGRAGREGRALGTDVTVIKKNYRLYFDVGDDDPTPWAFLKDRPNSEIIDLLIRKVCKKQLNGRVVVNATHRGTGMSVQGSGGQPLAPSWSVSSSSVAPVLPRLLDEGPMWAVPPPPPPPPLPNTSDGTDANQDLRWSFDWSLGSDVIEFIHASLNDFKNGIYDGIVDTLVKPEFVVQRTAGVIVVCSSHPPR
jgi:hypothetical protein